MQRKERVISQNSECFIVEDPANGMTISIHIPPIQNSWQTTTINKQDKANNNNKEKQTQKERTSRHTHPRNSNNKKGYTPSMETNLLSTTTSCRMRTIGKKDSLHPQLWSKEGRKCTMEITHILDHHIQDLNFRSRKRNVRMIILRDVYFNSRWI